MRLTIASCSRLLRYWYGAKAVVIFCLNWIKSSSTITPTINTYKHKHTLLVRVALKTFTHIHYSFSRYFSTPFSLASKNREEANHWFLLTTLQCLQPPPPPPESCSKTANATISTHSTKAYCLSAADIDFLAPQHISWPESCLNAFRCSTVACETLCLEVGAFVDQTKRIEIFLSFLSTLYYF